MKDTITYELRVYRDNSPVFCKLYEDTSDLQMHLQSSRSDLTYEVIAWVNGRSEFSCHYMSAGLAQEGLDLAEMAVANVIQLEDK